MSVLDQERLTLIGIVLDKRIDHFDAEIKRCPCCERITKGEFPASTAGPVQCGLGIKAFVLNQLVTQLVSLNRVQKLIKTLIGGTNSEAVTLEDILQLHDALESWEQDAIEKLVASPVMRADKTSLKLGKKNFWAHKCSGFMINRKIVAEILRRHGLVCGGCLELNPTTNAKHNSAEYENLLKQDFTATARNNRYLAECVLFRL